MFHQNYWFHLFDQSGHRKFSSCAEPVDCRIVDLCYLGQILDCPKYPKSVVFTHFAQSCNPQSQQVRIPPSRTQSKT